MAATNNVALSYAFNVTVCQVQKPQSLVMEEACWVYADLVPVLSSLQMRNCPISDKSTAPLKINTVVSSVVQKT